MKTYEVEFSRIERVTVEVEAETLDEAAVSAQGVVEDEDFVWPIVDDVVMESIGETVEETDDDEGDDDAAYLAELSEEHLARLHEDDPDPDCPRCADEDEDES